MTETEKEQIVKLLQENVGVPKGCSIKINEPLVRNTFLKLKPVFNEKYGKTNSEIMRSLLKEFGTDSDKVKGKRALSITASFNKSSFHIDIDDEEGYVNLMHECDIIASWSFESLRRELGEIYPDTLFVDVESRVFNGETQFKYNSFTLRKSLVLMTFLLLVCNNYIRYVIKVSESSEKLSSEQRWEIRGKKDIQKILNAFPIIDLTDKI